MKNNTNKYLLIGAGLVVTITALLYFKSKKTTPINNEGINTDVVTPPKGSNVTPKPIDVVTPPKGSNVAPKLIDVVPTNNLLQLAEQARLAELARLKAMETALIAERARMAEQERLVELARLKAMETALIAERVRLAEISRLEKIEQIRNIYVPPVYIGGGGGRGALTIINRDNRS
jgi:hypothetical protein